MPNAEGAPETGTHSKFVIRGLAFGVARRVFLFGSAWAGSGDGVESARMIRVAAQEAAEGEPQPRGQAVALYSLKGIRGTRRGEAAGRHECRRQPPLVSLDRGGGGVAQPTHEPLRVPRGEPGRLGCAPGGQPGPLEPRGAAGHSHRCVPREEGPPRQVGPFPPQRGLVQFAGCGSG